jgi:uncharacterized protein YndB with AHSA1/START domain
MNDKVAAFAVPPLEKSVLVRCDPRRAFDAFTAEIDRWWPKETHSVAKAASCGIEPFVGGKAFEIAHDGTRHEWGRVTAWNPPRGLTFTWHPGREEIAGHEVELRFTPEGSGTRVTLIHRGWEKLPPEKQSQRESYDKGWGSVFGEKYRAYANSLE